MPRSAVHPGKILADELNEIGVTPTEFARQIEVPANRISQIINGKRAITGDTSVRLAHWFGTKPEYWLTLQMTYDLEQALQHMGARVSRLPTKSNRIATATPHRTKTAR